MKLLVGMFVKPEDWQAFFALVGEAIPGGIPPPREGPENEQLPCEGCGRLIVIGPKGVALRKGPDPVRTVCVGCGMFEGLQSMNRGAPRPRVQMLREDKP